MNLYPGATTLAHPRIPLHIPLLPEFPPTSTRTSSIHPDTGTQQPHPSTLPAPSASHSKFEPGMDHARTNPIQWFDGMATRYEPSRFFRETAKTTHSGDTGFDAGHVPGRDAGNSSDGRVGPLTRTSNFAMDLQTVPPVKGSEPSVPSTSQRIQPYAASPFAPPETAVRKISTHSNNDPFSGSDSGSTITAHPRHSLSPERQKVPAEPPPAGTTSTAEPSNIDPPTRDTPTSHNASKPAKRTRVSNKSLPCPSCLRMFSSRFRLACHFRCAHPTAAAAATGDEAAGAGWPTGPELPSRPGSAARRDNEPTPPDLETDGPASPQRPDPGLSVSPPPGAILTPDTPLSVAQATPPTPVIDTAYDPTDVSRPHGCASCGRRFRRSHDLYRHVRSIHLGHRPHRCGVCGATFSRGEALRKHMEVHEGPAPAGGFT
ncbi:hypothetical protein HDU96_008991 [Phlyctochytrium bullatum]|nr:hypothetical protein HDU96_008991 [Phlyctochytrium bullatum]